MPTLMSILPTADDLLALEPEELGGVLMEIIPSASQSAGFLLETLLSQVYRPDGTGYARTQEGFVLLALAEAVEWLRYNGLIVRNPAQPAQWYLVTRRGKTFETRADVAAYAQAHALPLKLLQPALAEKVHLLFARGDYDIAVQQAFKEVEVSVRAASGLGDDAYGTSLMRKAFNPETGPLTDLTKVGAERDAELSLFTGAIGHAKNPTSHRHVHMSRETAARLIVFASHLLDIVLDRLATSRP